MNYVPRLLPVFNKDVMKHYVDIFGGWPTLSDVMDSVIEVNVVPMWCQVIRL